MNASIIKVEKIFPHTGTDTETSNFALTILGCLKHEMVSFTCKADQSGEEILCFARETTFQLEKSFEIIVHFLHLKITRRRTMQFTTLCRTVGQLI